MNEHRFKLKKDGKAVGYERYVYCDQREGYLKGKSLVPQHSKDGNNWEYLFFYAWELRTRPKGYWFDAQLDIDVYIEHDEKCCFVTLDKNGKDVFAGDGLLSKDGLRKYKVTWDERRCRWWLCGIDKAWAVNEPIWEEYELIEDKKDE
ncbi:hypothetical protein LCGC14_1065740 [marine sediment metagenome]|uniref:YopX protein domain-containing protein n=1 Tax=marine sediment metagenome TaxID=412755 RepID=A0A0F9QQK7_9ZZZZ